MYINYLVRGTVKKKKNTLLPYFIKSGVKILPDFKDI